MSDNFGKRILSLALTSDDWDKEDDQVILEPLPIRIKPTISPACGMSREQIETAIFGCVLMTNRLIVNAEIILPSPFYFSANGQRIFHAMRNKYRAGVRFSLHNLRELELDKQSEKELFSSTDNVATSHHIEYFCKALKSIVEVAG